MLGELLELTCQVVESIDSDKFSVYWSFNGKEIAEGCLLYRPMHNELICSSTSQLDGEVRVRTLRFKSARLADAGLYTCKIGNNATSVRLHVIRPREVQSFEVTTSSSSGNGTADSPLQPSTPDTRLSVSCRSACNYPASNHTLALVVAPEAQQHRPAAWRLLPQNLTIDNETCGGGGQQQLLVEASVAACRPAVRQGLVRLRCAAVDGHEDVYLLCPEWPYPLIVAELLAVFGGPTLLLALTLLLLLLALLGLRSPKSDVAGRPAAVV